MPFVGNINLGPAGVPEPAANSAQRARDRRRAAKPEGTTRQEDEAELASASSVDETQAIRSAKGNADEESRDDRTSQGYYTKGMNRAPTPAKQHRLDISG